MLLERKNRKTKEMEVLLGLIDLYLKQGRPIGSNTLKENGFDNLSSATIRNYFARLETEGFLRQHHASGGRIPTDKAYRLYAETKRDAVEINKGDDQFLNSLLTRETKELSIYFQEAAEAISELTGCAVFIAAPKFDQDFIVQIKLVEIDEKRTLCILITNFSLIHTEVLYLPKKMDKGALDRIEQYFHFRLTGLNKPKMSESDETFAKHAYNEIVLRHFVSYTNMQFEDVYKAGFSKLLHHPEFHDPAILSNTLGFFEHRDTVKQILKECFEGKELKYWIGDDLEAYIAPPYYTSAVAIPYRIHNHIVGAIALLGPDRLAYAKIFGILEKVSHYISENLTQTLYKYKINYRQPRSEEIAKTSDLHLIEAQGQSLIEKKYD